MVVVICVYVVIQVCKLGQDYQKENCQADDRYQFYPAVSLFLLWVFLENAAAYISVVEKQDDSAE